MRFTSFVPTTALIIIAGDLGYAGKEGCGWFLFVALITMPPRKIN